MEYSNYQKKIFETYKSTCSNIVIQATAGSGKSFSIKKLAELTPRSKTMTFVAFNKSIAEELKSKLPSGVDCSTMHAKGLGVLRGKFPGCTIKIKDSKIFEIAQRCIILPSDLTQKEKLIAYFELQSIYTLMRQNLIFDKVGIIELCAKFGYFLPDGYVEYIDTIKREVEKQDLYAMKAGGELVIDFTDMLYLPYKYVHPIEFKKYDVVFVDELQDMNPLQKEIILRFVKRGGRFVCAGDEMQCLYAFMGSSLDVFNSFKKMSNTITLPLGLSYRCATEIIEEAKTIFPEAKIEALPGSKGIVRIGEIAEAEPGDFILCRNNFPLITAYVQLLKVGKKSFIMGRDFGEALRKLMEKVTKIEDLSQMLIDKKEKIKKEYKCTEERAQMMPVYQKLVEQVRILEELFRLWGSASEIVKKLKEIYREENKGSEITLSTIHKSKGLEADRVFFLNPDLIPSKYATTPLAIYGEKCLSFVAITRAKKELIYCITADI